MITTPITPLEAPDNRPPPARIAVFLSKGRNYGEVLRDVRHNYPQARIDAVIPKAYPLSEEEQTLADAILETEQAQYSPRAIRPLCRLIRRLRAPHYDLFVILFDSPKLRLLARLSRARNCACHQPSRRLAPMQPRITSIFADILFRNVRGRLVYGMIWAAVHLLPVKRKK